MKEKNIQFVRGDTFAFDVGFNNVSAEPSELIMTIRAGDGKPVVATASISNGRVEKFVGEHDYDYRVKLLPSDTAEIERLQFAYRYDVEVTIGTDKYTILGGVCKIIPDMTR